MIEIVTGSRYWTDYKTLSDALDARWLQYKELEDPAGFRLFHGAAKGADTMSGMWCRRNDPNRRAGGQIVYDAPHEQRFNADWENEGKRAGPLRNQRMLNAALLHRDRGELVVVDAFPLPHSVGTRHMIRICREAGLEVTEHKEK